MICCEAGDDVSGLPVAAFCCFFFFKESLIKGVRQTFFFCACLFSKSFKGDLNPGSENLEVPRTTRFQKDFGNSDRLGDLNESCFILFFN